MELDVISLEEGNNLTWEDSQNLGFRCLKALLPLMVSDRSRWEVRNGGVQ